MRIIVAVLQPHSTRWNCKIFYCRLLDVYVYLLRNSVCCSGNNLHIRDKRGGNCLSNGIIDWFLLFPWRAVITIVQTHFQHSSCANCDLVVIIDFLLALPTHIINTFFVINCFLNDFAWFDNCNKNGIYKKRILILLCC